MQSWLAKIRGLLSPGKAANRYRAAGDRNRDAGNWDEATRQYQAYLSQKPYDFGIWVQLGHVAKEAGHNGVAERAYQAAYEINPDDADLLLHLGHFHRRLGSVERANDFYRRSYAMDFNEDALNGIQDDSFRLDAVDVARRRIERRNYRIRAGEPLYRPTPVGALDRIEGWDVTGWAIDPDDRDHPAEVMLFADGNLAASIAPTAFRRDVEINDGGTLLAGFGCGIDLDFSRSGVVSVSARLKSSGRELDNSPIKARAPKSLRKWLQRKVQIVGDELEMVRNRADACAHGKRLSIIMPVYNTNPDWLAQAIGSVIDQWCSQWELICVDDRSPREEIREILERFSESDARIKTFLLPDNVGIAAATNAGMEQATGDYIGFMDHDDYLEPDAVARMLATAHRTDADLLYSDEAVTGESIHHIKHIVARPAFSHDYYMSHPYFVHFICVRTDIARKIGGFDRSMTISADVDFVLRSIEVSQRVAHVPAVLYRWRTHGGSAGHAMASRVTDATVGALNRHLARMDTEAKASPGPHFNSYRVDFPDDGGKVAVIIPTKDQHQLVESCVESIFATCDAKDFEIFLVDHDSRKPESRAYFYNNPKIAHVIPFSGAFNFSAINNRAVEAIGSSFRYLLFMNNDVEAIEAGWLERMRKICNREDVGVVGATLLYPDRTTQHAGVVMGLGELAEHAHKFVPIGDAASRNPGYNSSLTSLRDYSAVTGACMMIRREVFAGVAGFDPRLEIGYNDTDLCLRIGSLGYRILCEPDAILYHHESVSRKDSNQIDHPEDGVRLAARWGTAIESGDIFYSPLLDHRAGKDHRLGSLDNWHHSARVRTVRPQLRPLQEGRPDAVDTALARRLSLRETPAG